MKIVIERLSDSKIAYFRSVGEYGGVQNKELMESFKDWLKLHEEFNNPTILGIPQDNPENTPKEDCRYDVCVTIKDNFNVTEPAKVSNFTGGEYAVFVLDHTKEAVSQFWGRIFTEIDKKKLVVREEPIIERYSSHMIENGLCEILVPIR